MIAKMSTTLRPFCLGVYVLLFLLFINDISNSTLDGCVLNIFADDVYASADEV